MLLVIIINALFALLVLVGMVMLHGWAIWSSRTAPTAEVARATAPAPIRRVRGLRTVFASR